MKHEEHTKEYFNTWKSIKLSQTSRARMQDELLKYAQFHAAKEGVRVQGESRLIKHVPAGTSFITRLSNYKLTSMTAFILIALLLGGGTSYAAQGSVPGDLLYPIKVDVNDNVRASLAFSNQARAHVQADLVKERLQEAEQLAVEGKLTASSSAELNHAVLQHYGDAIEHSNAVEAQGDAASAADVRASLLGTLHSYSAVLDHLNKNVHGNDGHALINSLTAYSDNVAQAQAKASSSVAADGQAQSSVATAIAHSNELLAKATSALAQSKSKFSADIYAGIAAELDDARSLQADAKASLNAKAYEDAYNAIQNANVKIAQAQNTIESALRLEVRSSVSLEGLFKASDDKSSPSASSSARENDKESEGVEGSSSLHLKTDLDTDLKAGTSSNKDEERNEGNDSSVLKINASSDASSAVDNDKEHESDDSGHGSGSFGLNF